MDRMEREPFKIIDRRTRNNRIEYLVQWDAEAIEENTWETRKLLRVNGHMEKIQEYEAKKTAMKQKKAAENTDEAETPGEQIKDEKEANTGPAKAESSAATSMDSDGSTAKSTSAVVSKKKATKERAKEAEEKEKETSTPVKRGRARSTSKASGSSGTKRAGSKGIPASKGMKGLSSKSTTRARGVLRSHSAKRKTIATPRELSTEKKASDTPTPRRKSLPTTSKVKSEASPPRSPRSPRSSLRTRSRVSRLMLQSPGPRVRFEAKKLESDSDEYEKKLATYISPESYEGAALFLDKKVYSQLTCAEVLLLTLMGVLILAICLIPVIPELSQWDNTYKCCHLGFVLLLLLGLLARKDLRLPSRLMEIALLWRAIGEVLHSVPAARDSLLLDQFCIGVSNFAAFGITVYFACTKPRRTDILVFVLSLLGVLTLFFTDVILGFFKSNGFPDIRPMLTTFALVLLSLAAINVPRVKKSA